MCDDCFDSGSDVNSMDSVDSCSTLGTGDGQQSGDQTSQSQSSELIVWEIEVPKVRTATIFNRGILCVLDNSIEAKCNRTVIVSLSEIYTIWTNKLGVGPPFHL